MDKTIPTPQMLRKLLRYEPDTGKLFWRERPVEMFTTGANTERQYRAWNTRYSGKEAGTVSQVYRNVGVSGRMYCAHRIIWAIRTGAWPAAEIDHINHNPTDNRWSNIRAVTFAENQKNKSLESRNTSGTCGVHWHKSTNKWQAAIRVRGRRIHLGCFVSYLDAVNARKAANEEYGFHPNHGEAK